MLVLKARTHMRFPDGRGKALTLSYDDGVEQDIRLTEILDRYGIKGTFNINSGCYAPPNTVYPKGQVHRRMSREAAIALLKDSKHEVASHTYNHAFLDSLPSIAVIDEIMSDRQSLEADFGRTVRGMALPYGAYNDEVTDVLKKCGIAYARTTRSTEDFDMPRDWLRLEATCRHRSPRLMELAREFVALEVNAKPKLFYLWGHSYEFEQDDNWSVIEEFCEYTGGRDDIWYATNIELYEYTEAYGRLVWSADMATVTNPSAVPIWLRYAKGEAHSRTVKIEAGETLKL